MTNLMVSNFLRNTHMRWIPLITVAYVPTFLTVTTMTQTESDISIVNNENFSCGYVGEQLTARTFSSDSENESNDRGG